jgi:hypothetical protein
VVLCGPVSVFVRLDRGLWHGRTELKTDGPTFQSLFFLLDYRRLTNKKIIIRTLKIKLIKKNTSLTYLSFSRGPFRSSEGPGRVPYKKIKKKVVNVL